MFARARFFKSGVPAVMSAVVWTMVVLGVHVQAEVPRVAVIPVQIRNAELKSGISPVQVSGYLRDPLEAAITYSINDAFAEEAGIRLVNCLELLRLAESNEAKLIKDYLDVSDRRRLSFPLSPALREKAASICDIVVIPQLNVNRIGDKGKARVSNISAQIVYIGKGEADDEINYRVYKYDGSVDFNAEFPRESEISGAFYAQYAKALAQSIDDYYVRSRRMAMEKLLSDLMTADAEDTQALAGLIKKIESLSDVPITEADDIYNMGRAYYAVQRYDDAQAWLTKAKELQAEPLPDVLTLLSEISRKKGDYPAAVGHLDEAYKLLRERELPSEGVLRDLLALTLEGGLREQRIQYLRILADKTVFGSATDEERLNAMMEIGAIQKALGSAADSSATLNSIADMLAENKILAIDPNRRIQALLDVKRALKDNGDTESANRIVNLLYTEAVSYIKAQRYAEGLYLLSFILEDTGSAGWFWNGYGLAKLDRANEAISAYQQAIKLDPGLIEAYYNLRLIYMAKGMNNEVVKLYTEGMMSAPANSHFRYGLAVARLLMRQYDAAIGSFASAGALDSSKAAKCDRAILECYYIKARNTLKLSGLSMQSVLEQPSGTGGKAIEWGGTLAGVRYVNDTTELDMKSGDAISWIVRIKELPPDLELNIGDNLVVVGRISKVQQTVNADGSRLAIPYINGFGLMPQDGMDYYDPPKAVNGENPAEPLTIAN